MSRPHWWPSTSVSIDAHFYDTAALVPRTYPGDQRATVSINGSRGCVTLYAERDGLARLRDVLADVVAQLDAARHNPAA
ncbi:hypothetical protein [Pseudonocardia sp. D17]|uniref:hypothetical protein n=1 Tax=Pseudonocardia sp. D17 TaxID=882661 RepID=UPI002B3E7B01|nr:hypothetical protein PSD17_27710 [Pseudonocardia sp. D17]